MNDPEDIQKAIDQLLDKIQELQERDVQDSNGEIIPYYQYQWEITSQE